MCDYEYKNPNREGERCSYGGYEHVNVYEEDKHIHKRFCVFHDPSENKDVDVFWGQFGKLIDKNIEKNVFEWDFEGFVFPKMNFKVINEYEAPENVKIDFAFSKFMNADFRGYKFPHIVSFINCEFSGLTHFGGAEFAGFVSFGYCKFKGRTSFEETKFRGDAGFFETEFEDAALFYRSEFHFKKGRADFRKAEFRRDVHFDGSKFLKKAEFMEAIFNDEATFNNTQFSGGVNFNKSRFYSTAVFSDFECYRRSNFDNIIFDGPAYFINSYFLTYTTFHKCIFNSICDFSRAAFRQIIFTGSIFKGSPVFSNLYAGSERVIFSGLNCHSKINFLFGYDPRFIKWDDIDAKDKNADIEKNKNKPFQLSIYGCDFKGLTITFCQVTFIDIYRSNIYGYSYISPKYENNLELDFRSVNFYGDFIVENSIIIKAINSYINGKVYFTNCNLENTSFLGTYDLRNIDFIDCKWPKINRSSLKRVKSLREKDCFSDEITSRDSKFSGEPVIAKSLKIPNDKRRKLSEMYRAVASSFESKHRYGSAGPFKVGEFEMRREMKETPWTEEAVLWLYKAASSYGESVWKPLFVLIFFVWIIPTIIYLFGGFPEATSVNDVITYKIINYDWGLPFSLLQTLLDLLKAFIFSLQALFAFGSDKLSQLTGYASYFPVLQKLFGSIFTALFLFALRRKARR